MGLPAEMDGAICSSCSGSDTIRGGTDRRELLRAYLDRNGLTNTSADVSSLLPPCQYPTHPLHDPDDDLHRILRCWLHQDCGGCVREGAVACGWCASSLTCLPLPSPPHVVPLLSAGAEVCGDREGARWELRTGTLGCGVSAGSVLAFLIGIAALFGVVLIILVIWVAGKWIWRLVKGKRAAGWEVDGEGNGKVWVRETRGWRQMFRRKKEEEIEVLVGEDEQVGRWRTWWIGITGGKTRTVPAEVEEEERRPLLG